MSQISARKGVFWRALATKTFKIRVPNRGLDVPIRFVEPDEMVKQGLDRRTVYYVHWRGEDPDRPPNELFEVLLNKDFEDKFRALSSRQASAASEHIARNIAAHVYADVLSHVLGTDGGSEEPNSLTSVVADLIENEFGMSLEAAKQEYGRGPGGRAKLMPRCWKLAGADKVFATMKL